MWAAFAQPQVATAQNGHFHAIEIWKGICILSARIRIAAELSNRQQVLPAVNRRR